MGQSWSVKIRVLMAGAVVLVLAIYSYPALRTATTTGSRVLPPSFSPDLSLYLNISTARTSNAGQVVEPYYGIDVPMARMGYLKFRTAFRLFGGLNTLLHRNLWWTMLLWNLFWWGVLCVVAVWFFREVLPENSPAMVLAGMGFLLLFNFGILLTQAQAWIHLPGLQAFEHVPLPYIRPFFPQISVPLVILYLGLQIRALQRRAWPLWTGMAAIQFLAFTTFPYAVLIMSGITAVAILGEIISGHPLRWTVLLGYTAICALSDLAFLLHGNQISRSGGPVQEPLIHLQLSVLPHRIGGMWIVLALLSVLILLARDLTPEIRWPIFGLGISVMLILLGDVFFSETQLQMSVHGAYFVHPAAAILFTFVLSAWLKSLQNNRIWRFVLCAGIVFIFLNGILLAAETYRSSLPFNREQSELSAVLRSSSPQATDLVIARSLSVDDDCAWVPLASPSHVLYCRNAQVLLSPEQNQKSQRFRQALYLYFTNRDHQWVNDVLTNPSAIGELSRLTFLGQVTTNVQEREKNIEAVQTELVPLLVKVEDKDPEVSSFLQRYRRMLVIDNANDPYFALPRLSEYLRIENRQRSGDLLVLECTSLQSGSNAAAH